MLKRRIATIRPCTALKYLCPVLQDINSTLWISEVLGPYPSRTRFSRDGYVPPIAGDRIINFGDDGISNNSYAGGELVHDIIVAHLRRVGTGECSAPDQPHAKR